MSIEHALQEYEGQPLTQAILMDLLKEYRRPHNKLLELQKKEILTPVKRGLYITGPALKSFPPSRYLLANHIYGPSYVSLEPALAHWGLIPEMVTTVTSMTIGASRSFSTPLGLFRYIHLKLPYYCFGIRQVELATNQTVLMAGPEKALCDIIVERTGVLLRSVKQARSFFEEDLRIEREALKELDREMIRSWVKQAPKRSSINILIKTLDSL